MITYRLGRSFAWNAGHPPKLPARPRKLPAGPPAFVFGRRVECPVGIAAGPLPLIEYLRLQHTFERLGHFGIAVRGRSGNCQSSQPNTSAAYPPTRPD